MNAEALRSLIASTTDDAIFMLDPDGIVVSCDAPVSEATLRAVLAELAAEDAATSREVRPDAFGTGHGPE